jgi:hypothetical protein
MRIRILVLTALGLTLAAAGAAAKSPVLGVSSGPQGVVAPSGAVKYVAMGARGGATVVRAIRLRDHKLVLSRRIPGRFGIALVTYGGTMGGLSHDGKTLVLPALDRGETTRFAVLSTATLRLRKVITLDGLHTFDALSPDGQILYTIEYLSDTDYQVRAVSVATGTLFEQVVVDKREAGEPMTGYPVARVTDGNGVWAYTLYGRDGKPAFVHALYTTERGAVCIDLPWAVDRSALMHVRMSMDGTDLVLRDRAGKVAVVDTANGYRVKAIRKPR